ncbi:hypothetical protein BCR41DRAFT_348480 [Lobosporangium transversale]|uniref:F-box domain-containing protein n=1 Tax=Lobosporangium transversale TaxID=64571 RepID=A0A1Y2GXK2_9FUNG|nr:hypothetical protein BCR41DRAFT_348480 [Lobosporangium transversale]ORZ26544.1 hypothetical protein BCR41DRAFT_348480 [Lobosporangium transversale]|eukprot:XP_021884309.1 hypothetical protein BCR41DRAFT_348480 [Lobosporangium transversale]
MSQHPLHIPEIISLVGDFLSLEDTLQCIRVSKSFHEILIKFIWSRITVTDDENTSYPTGEALQNNKIHLEELELYHFPEEYVSLQGCARLHTIKFVTSMPVYEDPVAVTNLSAFIKAHNSTITKFTCYGPIPQRTWKALLKCPNLNHLVIDGTGIMKEIVDDFFQMCKRLEYLELSKTKICQLPTGFLSDPTDNYVFAKMSTLRLLDVTIQDPSGSHSLPLCPSMLIKKCPNLRSLAFQKYQRYKAFCGEALFQQPWTLSGLSDLSFLEMDVKDEDMASLLRQITELKQLVLSNKRHSSSPEPCSFGWLSMQELLADRHMIQETRFGRLCEMIETITFDVRGFKTDGILLAILCNCPCLKQLIGPKITVTEIVNGAEWVCTKLADLTIYIQADVDYETIEGLEKQRAVFKQLGKLTRLRSLDLAMKTAWHPAMRTLNLRLKAGLDELSSLKRLEGLKFHAEIGQQMQPEDATWMMDNWPNIKQLRGNVNANQDIYDSIANILQPRASVSNY